jgi:glycosyltransferase involved in cell wall biosynthesis
MFVSKHHYAIELAKRGNQVYFLNPPAQDSRQRETIEVIPSGIDPNLFLVNHKLWFPYQIKFHAMPLFHRLMKLHVRKIIKKIPQPVDILWSFDLGNYYPFDFFSAKTLKIFHPVDEPLNQEAIDSAKGCHVIFSVTPEILEKYARCAAPKYFINHGITEDFLSADAMIKQVSPALHVGCSGNLLRNDIDRDTLLTIIRENPQVVFDLFGSYTQSQSNIGGTEDATVKKFIAALRALPNITLHGAISPPLLAAALYQMDAFLICYDIKKDQSRGTNYHKIMEYLSTGKVIISNNVTAYQSNPELVTMIGERENNHSLPSLFKHVISNLEDFNSPDLRQRRIAFARENTYQKQIDRIEEILLNGVLSRGRPEWRDETIIEH